MCTYVYVFFSLSFKYNSMVFIYLFSIFHDLSFYYRSPLRGSSLDLGVWLSSMILSTPNLLCFQLIFSIPMHCLFFFFFYLIGTSLYHWFFSTKILWPLLSYLQASPIFTPYLMSLNNHHLFPQLYFSTFSTIWAPFPFMLLSGPCFWTQKGNAEAIR